MTLMLGIDLPRDEQRKALAMFVHRYTGSHKPAWALKPWRDGKPYPVQFECDTDWLRNTEFHVTKAGRLSLNHRECVSHPTWPENPELRKSAA